MELRTHAGRRDRRRGAASDASPGKAAASFAPPASGIDFADRGLPERLRAGIESLCGLDLSDVRVHANSSKPAQLNALAYAQGNDIHLGPGQERSLPHEAWHVVQQRQGRVQPTLQMNGSAVNDDAGLEREADSMGARALQTKGDFRAAGGQDARGGAPVVQRDIGFEYETGSVDTYLAAAKLSKAQRQAAGFPPGAAPLGKGTVLIANMKGFHAKADQGGGGLGSNLELETDPVPETGAGRAALSRTLTHLERFCELIETKCAVTPHMRSSHLAFAFGGTAPVSLRYIRAGAPITGNPQATVGIRLDKLEELMERSVGGPTAGPNAIGGAPAPSRIELGSHQVLDFGLVGDAPATTRLGIGTYAGAYGGAAPLPAGFPSDELVGLSSLLLTYIIKGAGAQLPYAKQIAPLMARTDFGAIFTNSLPPPEQAFLSAANGAEFLAMFTQIVAQAGIGNGLGAQIFAFDPLFAPGLNISTSLTRRRWLRGISQNNDRLTPATFPSVPAQPQLAGLGEMGATQDPDPTGGVVARPIFELRRMRQSVTPHAFTKMAMGVFDFVLALNAAGPGVHPAYARVPRPHVQPKWHQKLRYKLAGG